MSNPTSLAAFAEMKTRGWLTGWHAVIAEVLSEAVALTQNEICERVQRSHSNLGKSVEVRRKVQPHTLSSRFAEMVRAGKLKVVGTKVCEVTGKQVNAYQLPDTAPSKLVIVKRPSKLKAAEARIKELEASLVAAQQEAHGREAAKALVEEALPASLSDEFVRLKLGDPNPPANWRAYIIGQYAKSPNAAGWRVLVGTIFAREFSNMPVVLTDLLEVTRAGLNNNLAIVHRATGLTVEELTQISDWLTAALATASAPEATTPTA